MAQANESDWVDVDSGDDSGWKDVPAANNSVFDAKGERVLSLPPTLNAREANYLIAKDVDKKQGFAGQVYTGYIKPSAELLSDSYVGVGAKALAEGVVRLPTSMDGILLEKANELKQGLKRPEDVKNYRSDINVAIREMFRAPETPEEAQARYDFGVQLEQKYQQRKKEVEDTIKGSWMDTSDVQGYGKKFLAGFGSSMPSWIAATSATILTRNPLPAMAYYYTNQRSESYQRAFESGKDTETASRIATEIAVPVSALDMIGLGMFMKGLKRSGLIQKVFPIAAEGVTEGAQSVVQDTVYNIEGVDNISGGQMFENAVISAAVGSMMAGTGAVVFGHTVAQDLQSKGVPEAKAIELGKKAQESFPAIMQEASDFIDAEFAPIASSKEEVEQFKSLFQKFVTGKPIQEELDGLTAEQRKTFDDYVEYFNTAARDKSGQEAVEKDFYNRLIEQGLDPEEAMTTSKLYGQYIERSARMAGMTPMERHRLANLRVEKVRTSEEATAVIQEKLDAAKASVAEVAAPEDTTAQVEAMRGTLEETKAALKQDSKKGKYPILTWVKSQGGIKLDSNLAAEMKVLGITARSMPGLFKTAPSKHVGELDNIPLKEFNERFGVAAKADETGNYVDRGWLLQAIADEYAGKRLGSQDTMVDESFLEALDRAGLDVNTVTAEEVIAALGPEADVIATAAGMGEIIDQQQAREILGLQEELGIDIEDAVMLWAERDSQRFVAENEAALSEAQAIEADIEEIQKPLPEFVPDEQIKPIEDFGEKIVGAKKDLHQQYRDSMRQELPEDLREVTLSKVFPAPDYEALIENGADVRALAAIKAMREEIPSKPRKDYLLRRWGEALKLMRQFSNELLDGKYTVEQILEKMRERGTGLRSLADKIEFYGALGYPAFKNADKNTFVGRIADDRYSVVFHGRKIGERESYKEALQDLSSALQTAPEGETRSVKLDIYQVTKTGEIFIGKKVGSGKFIDLRGGFKTPKEARAYLKEHEAGLLELLERKKNIRPERKSVNDPRKGEDYRMGENVTPEKFAAEFGFRGVQFGNYVEQGKRSDDLNNAYDALLDLAGLIGTQPRALSLNGGLGLAFGARGSGGKNAASAHFETQQVVINLTKKAGAGSLGHEWWHSLDNFFGRMSGKGSDKFLTDLRLATNPEIRPEVIEAFNNVMTTIKGTGLYKRSRELDSTRTKDYWSTDIEMSARAFEAYLIDKAAQKGLSNDYLANIVDEEVHSALNSMAGSEQAYPYPTKEERKVINAAFDKLFSTLKTKPTEKGITFYQAMKGVDKEDGRQAVIPGAERITDKELAERKGEAPLRANKAQKAADEGLFGDAYKQGSLFQNGSRPQGARGSITFMDDGALIKLFETADRSTILHELGHFFLRDMRELALKSNRPMVAREFETIKKWLGAKGNTFTELQEEKFARGFEAYLREGKAPVEGLKAVFEKFKEWLTSIYKTARQLDVTINDDIREVFDRMLGGDFARSEAQIQARGVANVEADYERVAQPPPSTLGADTASIMRNAGQIGSDIFTPISSRLGRIHPKLKAAVRKFTFYTGLNQQRDRKVALPFLEGMESMTDEDYRIFDLALKNRDEPRVQELAKKYGFTDAYAAVKTLLDEIYARAVNVGMDIEYLQDYFPRMVKLGQAKQYLDTLRSTENWSAIAEALNKEDPNNMWTDEEKAVFVNQYLRGLPPGITTMHKPSFTKERNIDYVKPEHVGFYLSSGESLLQYIRSMRLGIEQREIFGKGANPEESIGAYVSSMVKQGLINHRQEDEVRHILNALMNNRGPGQFVAFMKNAGYVYLMGSPISAITQIQDLAFSMANNGYYNTAVSLTKALARKSVLKKEDIGIDNIAQEFESETRASRTVRNVFKAVGLEWMDNIGKQVYIESAHRRLQAEAKKNGKEYKDNLSNIFGDEADSVHKDLLDGTISDNVKELLYSELSDVQPTSLAEMPVGYLRGGNWRSLYMLKTYTVKQIDIYRRDIFDKLATGEKAQVVEGLQNLIRLASALMLMGMTSDALKDLILGRDLDLSDLVMDNIIKTMGITKYQIYQTKQDGLANTVMQYMFVPPLYAPVDNLIKDITKIAEGKIEPNDAQSLSYVPVVGKFYYWWVGGGHEKTLKAEAKRQKEED